MRSNKIKKILPEMDLSSPRKLKKPGGTKTGSFHFWNFDFLIPYGF